MRRYRVSISWSGDRNLEATYVMAASVLDAGELITRKYGVGVTFRVMLDS